MAQIYLIKSDSYRLLNKELNKILDGITNISRFSLLDTTIYECIDDASYFGMFDEKRAIIIKDVKYFGGKYLYEEETSTLLSFLEKIDDIIIIFICDEIKKTKDITKNIIKLGANIIDYSSIDTDVINKEINEYCNELKIIIDEEAKNLLIKNEINNIDLIIQEIDKLSLVDKHITVDIVKNYSSVNNDDETFDFSNAVIAKDFTKAFDILDRLIINGVEVVSLVGLLASSYTNMYMVRDAVSNNLTDEDIAKKFGYSGTGRVYVMKKNSKIYTMEDLKNIILSLAELDKKIKTGVNPVYGLKEFLLNL